VKKNDFKKEGKKDDPSRNLNKGKEK